MTHCRTLICNHFSQRLFEQFLRKMNRYVYSVKTGKLTLRCEYCAIVLGETFFLARVLIDVDVVSDGKSVFAE